MDRYTKVTKLIKKVEVPVLKHHATKAFVAWGSGGITPCILNLITRLGFSHPGPSWKETLQFIG
jgi:hypothetical protein